MDLHNVHIKCIKQANEEDRLAIFVGSGISKSSDTDYMSLPLWSDLINEIKSDLAITEEVDYLKLAQLHYLEFGEQRQNQTLKKYFPENIEPSSLHSTILKVNPRVIITTNWDCIIEKAIEKEGYLYETICTDKDLVKSTNQNKFIKIHGDFKNHNIVFKEDDYLNYSRNFPLIENYIKSIFSTHTVLFLGYSYNDINLKHIMKWIQSHSSSVPPMYLVNFNSNTPQEIYLKNYGVTTLVLDKDKYPIDEITNLEERAALIQSFLNHIIANNLNIYEDNEGGVINYIYDRLKHLKQQNSISHNQIKKAITNCGFYYDVDGLSILELYTKKGYLTVDYNDSGRLINEKFIDILTRISALKEDEKKDYFHRNYRLSEIFSILTLADIKGVALSKSNYFVNEKIISSQSIELKDRNFISFKPYENKCNDLIKTLLSESYEHYKNENYKLAIKKNSELILTCKRHRIYSILLISLFNKNSILWKIKYSYETRGDNEFKNEPEVKLQDEFFKFPSVEIKNNQVLYDFLSLHSVHQEANECTRKLFSLVKTVNNIKKGGFSLNNNVEKPTSTHMNLLMFALKNHIMIDVYKPYIEIMRDFVRISILRQSIKDVVKLNQYEIYSAINFFSSEELKSELSVFCKKDNTEQIDLSITDECTEWIVSTVLPNLTERLIQDKSIYDTYKNKFENCVRILAVLNLKDEYISKIMDVFSSLISSTSTTIGTYEAINEFLAYQLDLFKREIKANILISILNTLIDKIILHKAHGWDQHALQYHSIGNLYYCIQVTKSEYNDKERIKKLLSELQKYSVEEQKKFSKSLIYSIFNISNSNIRKEIETFIRNLISQPETKDIDDWEFDLWCVAVEFKDFESETVTNLDEYLEQYRDGKSFSSKLYSLKSLIKFLIDNKEIHELEKIDQELSVLIEKHKSRPNYSII
ncbi:hypothetical protein AYY19_11215 [Photobacterium aquimaris]|uniref:SIR2 family protein n=1 Tax=Photobacterium aquimaris TaxID=512643 RepID=UPI0007EF10D7|nr:SIR2 family protein [Photobacterium aquimaris]OBU18008.1 hypothetical protein AYY19_11215 [Photobacterium aquimaris]